MEEGVGTGKKKTFPYHLQYAILYRIRPLARLGDEWWGCIGYPYLTTYSCIDLCVIPAYLCVYWSKTKIMHNSMRVLCIGKLTWRVEKWKGGQDHVATVNFTVIHVVPTMTTPVPIWSPPHDHMITSTWPHDSWSPPKKKLMVQLGWKGMGGTTLILCIPMRVVVIPGTMHNSMRKTRIGYHGWRKKLCGHVPVTYSHFDCATLLKIMIWPPPDSKSKTCTFHTFWGGYWPRTLR